MDQWALPGEMSVTQQSKDDYGELYSPAQALEDHRVVDAMSKGLSYGIVGCLLKLSEL